MSTREVPLDSTQGSAVHRVSALVDELNANEPTLHDLFHDSVSDIPEELSEQPSDSNDQPSNIDISQASELLRLIQSLGLANTTNVPAAPNLSEKLKITDIKRRPFRPESSKKFNGELEHFENFANEAFQHVRATSFDTDLYIFPDGRNLFKDYTSLSSDSSIFQMIKDDLSPEASDDDEHLYSTIYKSLTHDFTIELGSDVPSAVRSDGLPSGANLFLLIARRVTSTQDTLEATAQQIQDATINDFSGDVIAFSRKIKIGLHALRAGGWIFLNGTIQNKLLIHLSADPRLPQYFGGQLATLKSKFDRLPMLQKNKFDIESVLDYANKIYLNLKKEGLWTYATEEATTDPAQMIMALTAQVNTLEKQLVTMNKTPAEKPQKKQSKYYRIDPPKEGEPEEFTRPDGTTVYFCKKHNWNLSHGNSDCYAQKSENSELNDKLQKKINPIVGLSSIVKEK